MAVAAGAFHSLLVGDRGSMWACGANDCGQLGIGAAPRRFTSRVQSVRHEIELVPAHHRALQPSGGGYHSLVLTHSGAVLSFGNNGSGQLGLGDQTERGAPCVVPLPGGEVACAVAAGGDYSLVLTERGDLFGFGSRRYGALGGPAATEFQKLPVRVPLGTPVRQIAAGYDHALAVAADGRVLSWGSAGEPHLARLDPSRAEAHPAASPGDSLTHWRDHPTAVGQLGRPLDSTAAREADGWSLPHAYSSSPALATPLGPCELVAAGSFFSLGILRRGAGGGAAETEEATVHHGVDVLVRGGIQVAIASSAPPHE